MAVTSVERHSVAPCSQARSSESDHHAIGIDEAIGRTEAAAEHIVGAQLRHASRQCRRASPCELASVPAIFAAPGWCADSRDATAWWRRTDIPADGIPPGWPSRSSNAAVKRDGVQRHLNVRRGGELRAHSAHALAGRAFALMRFALDDQHVAATCFGQVPGDAGADDAAANDDYFAVCMSLGP